MSIPSNVFDQINNLASTLGTTDFYEQRLDNDSAGRPMYVGFSPTPNANVDSQIWFIRKLSYDNNNFINRVQIPDNGAGFIYSWTSRASYFS
ncbi:MAG: hypothetical protein K2X08_06750 [Chlamydiales bacterium]|jgi:hypothetical protein|nr:hypothetical protein [Chlamydiales bacterium]